MYHDHRLGAAVDPQKAGEGGRAGPHGGAAGKKEGVKDALVTGLCRLRHRLHPVLKARRHIGITEIFTIFWKGKNFIHVFF